MLNIWILRRKQWFFGYNQICPEICFELLNFHIFRPKNIPYIPFWAKHEFPLQMNFP